MKQNSTLRKLVLASCIAGTFVAGNANAQHTSHPAAYGVTGGTNFYKDYVGMRLQVTQPASSPLAKDYTFTTPYNSAGTGWGATVTTPMVDVPVYMWDGTPGNDSFACSGLTASCTGHIALVWRGPASGACEFGAKALAAQNAGAVAVVIINEFIGEGPVGMAAGASGASVTVPVFMVGNYDGAALAGLYRSSAAGTVKMTITPWGKGLTYDLGFVPGGASVWHNCATPSYQVASVSPAASPYMGLDGAFIANYGSADVIAPTLTSSLSFTPTSGAATTLHTNTLTFNNGGAAPTVFASADSIYAMFGDEFDMTSMVTGKGTYNLTYNINLTPDHIDEATGDNTFTHTFSLTDSTFSKGRYDMVKDQPIASYWTGPVDPAIATATAATDYLWGVPYYIAKGGAAIKNISFSVASGVGALPGGANTVFYVFKWVDGAPGATYLDSAIEAGELQLVGAAQRTYDGTLDSSFQIFTTSKVTDDTTGNGGGQMIHLADNSWYYICAQVSGGLALGCDGILDQYPRSYGRKHWHNYTELYNPLWPAANSGGGTPAKDQMWASSAVPVFYSYFGGGSAYDVDSVFYDAQKGLVPAISFKVTPWVPNAVQPVAPVATKFAVYPNPAANEVNVSIELPSTAKNVSYTIISSTAQLIGTEKRTNVQNDKYTYNTSKLASGNYFMIVNVDGKIINKKFTVIK